MSKICLVLTGDSVARMTEGLNACGHPFSMAEIRVDTLNALEETKLGALIELLHGRGIKVIWTVRRREERGHFQGNETERLQALQMGDRLGADYVDVELRCPLSEELKLDGAKRILSYHDFDSTPDHPEAILDEMERLGADVAKVAFQASGTRDCARVMSLYCQKRHCDVLAIAMGEYGSASRLFGSRLGMPWTYATSERDGGTAPGQLSLEELCDLYRYESISQHTRLFTVIGNPVGHSLSPALHNGLYIREGIDACYGKIRVDDMDAFYDLAETIGLDGVSVTVPHKEDLIRWLPQDNYLRKVGAANTLIRRNDHWEVENTDIEAALTAIELQLTESLQQIRVLLLGAGGVSRSLAHGMHERGWSITITNRTKEKAQSLAAEVDGEWLHWDDRCAHGFDVVVNGTSLGMTPNENATPLEFEGGHTGLVVFDTVYTPENTTLLQMARSSGARTVSGREMFHRQAALQHAHWFGGPPPWEAMQEILREI